MFAEVELSGLVKDNILWAAGSPAKSVVWLFITTQHSRAPCLEE